MNLGICCLITSDFSHSIFSIYEAFWTLMFLSVWFADLPAPQCGYFKALMNMFVLTHKGIFTLKNRARGYCRQGFARLNVLPFE